MPTAPNIFVDALVQVDDVDAFQAWVEAKRWPIEEVGVQEVASGKRRLYAMRMLRPALAHLQRSTACVVLKHVDPYADVADIEEDIAAIYARRSLFHAVALDAAATIKVRELVPASREVVDDGGKTETRQQSLAFADFGDGYKRLIDKGGESGDGLQVQEGQEAQGEVTSG